ncbi:MAG: hypothetical protein K2Z81_23545 [Cyanobacteria bacterium]|nr:hypothetical protein [Cyanobacteriota bacterium]
MLDSNFDNSLDGIVPDEKLQAVQSSALPMVPGQNTDLYAARVDWECQNGVCVLRWKPQPKK